jgi:hypothetical protein
MDKPREMVWRAGVNELFTIGFLAESEGVTEDTMRQWLHYNEERPDARIVMGPTRWIAAFSMKSVDRILTERTRRRDEAASKYKDR